MGSSRMFAISSALCPVVISAAELLLHPGLHSTGVSGWGAQDL